MWLSSGWVFGYLIWLSFFLWLLRKLKCLFLVWSFFYCCYLLILITSEIWFWRIYSYFVALVIEDGICYADKLGKRASAHQKDDEFIELINNIDRIRHANVVELVGYCSEHGQRLLIYEYCSNGSLFDALHSDDDFKTRLSWNSRIRISLGAARALE